MKPCAHWENSSPLFYKKKKLLIFIRHFNRLKMKNQPCTIRPLLPEETHLLSDFLYEAIYLPEGTPPPPRSVIQLPELQVYIRDFGTQPDDHCLVAEASGKVVGAVWVRQMNDYGHVDGHTPSLAISLYKDFRGHGIGTCLMKGMLDLLHGKSYRQVSLSVQKANPAVRLYTKLGFEAVKETEEEYIMVCNLSTHPLMKTSHRNQAVSPAITFRPATTADIPELKSLFCNTVLTVNARDYTTEEVADWASCGDRPGRWEKLLASLHFIAVCDAEGRIIGFTSIRNDGYLHSMFVHKDHQGEGIATALLQQIEVYATEHGIRKITSEVSITARPFFEHQGYAVEREQRAQANRLQLTNYVMRKILPSSLATQTENKQQTAQQSSCVTPRFRLRPWEASDVSSLAKYLNNKKIWDNCRDRLPFPYTEADARSFIDYATSRQEPGEYCIEINGEAAGNISFMRGTDVERFNAETGYWLAEPFWNQGIASEALREALRQYLAATDVVRIFANVYESNIASMRVLEKVGFRKVGVLRNACFKNGRFVDAHYFELLKEEFA